MKTYWKIIKYRRQITLKSFNFILYLQTTMNEVITFLKEGNIPTKFQQFQKQQLKNNNHSNQCNKHTSEPRYKLKQVFIIQNYFIISYLLFFSIQ